MTKTKDVYWAFCTYDGHQYRWARGFILASNKKDATIKGRKRVMVERRRAYKQMGVDLRYAPKLKGGAYRVRVWRDPERSCAPTFRHYVERARA